MRSQISLVANCPTSQPSTPGNHSQMHLWVCLPLSIWSKLVFPFSVDDCSLSCVLNGDVSFVEVVLSIWKDDIRRSKVCIFLMLCHYYLWGHKREMKAVSLPSNIPNPANIMPAVLDLLYIGNWGYTWMDKTMILGNCLSISHGATFIFISS